MNSISPREEALINEMEGILLRPVEPDKMSKPLFHYTDASGFKGIIESGNLWATHFEFLNDRQDLRQGEDIVAEEATKLIGEFPEGTPRRSLFEKYIRHHPQMRLSEQINVCVASLSEEGDLLSQWRAYGSDGSGFVIGFRTLPVPYEKHGNAQAGLTLYRCEYDPLVFRTRARAKLLEMAEAFDGFLNAQPDSKILFDVILESAVTFCFIHFAMEIPRLKNQAFSEEKEWRLVVIPGVNHEKEIMKFKAVQNGLKPYVEVGVLGADNRIDFDSVVIGPGQEAERSLRSATLFLKHHGYGSPNLLRHSLAPYRGTNS